MRSPRPGGSPALAAVVLAAAAATARLYTLSQPGHSLWGIAAGNPIDPACLSGPGGGDRAGRLRVPRGTR